MLILLMAAPTSAILLPTSAADTPATCLAGQTLVHNDLGTGEHEGVPDALGSADAKWTVASTPSSGAATSAYSITPYSTWVKPTASRWINPYGAGTGDNTAAPAGSYSYVYTFTIGGAVVSPSLDFRSSIDNSVQFFLNNNSIGSNAGFTQWHSFSYSNASKFVTGTNVLEARVYNSETYTGLLMEGTESHCEFLPIPASCEAYAVKVIERDATGLVGDAEANFSRSAVNAMSAHGTLPATAPGPTTVPFPPVPALAHAEAHEEAVAYANPATGLRVSSDTVDSRCDVQALTGAPGSWYDHAYGNGGVERLSIELGSATLLRLEAADFEAMAIGQPQTAFMTADCELVGVSGPTVVPSQACPPPWTTAPVPPPANAIVTVTFNEQWGPNAIAPTPFYWDYGGDVAHVHIVVPGVTIVDVCVGLVNVGVVGGTVIVAAPGPGSAGDCGTASNPPVLPCAANPTSCPPPPPCNADASCVVATTCAAAPGGLCPPPAICAGTDAFDCVCGIAGSCPPICPVMGEAACLVDYVCSNFVHGAICYTVLPCADSLSYACIQSYACGMLETLCYIDGPLQFDCPFDRGVGYAVRCIENEVYNVLEQLPST